LSVEILTAVVVVGGVLDLALLLFAMNSGRYPYRPASDAPDRSSGGGRTDTPAGPRARRRTLFVAASGWAPDASPALDAVPPPGSPLAAGSGEDSPESSSSAAVATAAEPDSASERHAGQWPDEATDELGAPILPAEADRGPTILERMSHASQAFGVADPGQPVEATAGVEGASGWARIVEVEGARLLRYRRPVTVVVAEVDGLQRLVDRLGAEPAQRLLVVVGDMFRREARSSDWVAGTRPGCFAVLLIETDESHAVYYTERVRRVCEPWLASAAVPLGLAMGWSGVPASSDLEFALHRAEERMHADRRAAGRWSRRMPRGAAADRAPDGSHETWAPGPHPGGEVPGADSSVATGGVAISARGGRSAGPR
jgi:GGDEF domain-containing protein